MLKSDICGPRMNLERGNEQSNSRIRIIRESSLKRMNWLYKHKDKESVHEGTKKSISSNESHFELPVFSW